MVHQITHCRLLIGVNGFLPSNSLCDCFEPSQGSGVRMPIQGSDSSDLCDSDVFCECGIQIGGE